RVDELPLRLTVGKAVRFDLYANAVATHAAGRVVDLDAGEFERVATVGTKLAKAPPKDEAGRETSAPQTAPSDVLPVVLQGCLTPVGTLELACETEAAPHQRFALAFEVRSAATDSLASTQGARDEIAVPKPSAAPAATENPIGTSAAAQELLHRVFGKGREDVHAREVKDLWRALEQTLGPRQGWDIGLTRGLADVLLALAPGRRRSADRK